VTVLVLYVEKVGSAIVVRVGRAVESISLDYKTRAELVEAVRFAALSKGIPLDDLETADLVEAALR
jgi:hypothetical protein